MIMPDEIKYEVDIINSQCSRIRGLKPGTKTYYEVVRKAVKLRNDLQRNVLNEIAKGNVISQGLAREAIKVQPIPGEDSVYKTEADPTDEPDAAEVAKASILS